MSTSAEAAPRPSSRAKHPVDEVIPVGKLAVYGFQDVLAFYAGAVIVPILLASAIDVSTRVAVTRFWKAGGAG
jgi:xanthine/uracil permease